MTRYLVLLAFFCSGLTSLVLENLWVRMLVLVFGGTTLAIVTVLTAFMGGLALGSYVAGKRADTFRRPVLVYGLLECGVAVYSLLLPFAFDALPWLYRLIPLDWPFWVTGLYRFVLCSVLLLIPTTLMGATLPVLSRYFVRNQGRIGVDVGVLYSANTLGAVVGALGGGFFILPVLGHQKTLWCVGAMLFLLAVLMMVIGRVAELDGSVVAEPSREAVEEEEVDAESSGEFDGPFFQKGEAIEGKAEKAQAEQSEPTPSLQDLIGTQSEPALHPTWLVRMVLGSIAVTGALAMVCQVIWSRALAMVIGSSTYAFSLILGTFLMGLALGAGLGAWIARRSLNLVRSWCYLLVGTALAVGLGVVFLDRLPVLFVALVYDYAKTADPWLLFSLKGLVSSIPILLPTLLMGTFFPLALAIFSEHNTEHVSRNVGGVYAANTLGSIVGSAAAGFVVIPLFGMQGGLALCVTLYMLCALGLWCSQQAKGRVSWAIVAAATCIGIWLFPSWHPGRMGLGMFRLSLFNTYTYKQAVTPGKVLFYKEGVSATVSVEGSATHRALKVNGKTDASNVGDRSTQIGVAALPMLIHGKPKDTVVVGWGSGMTVGAALQLPSKQITAVELEPAVVEGAKLFTRWNFDPLNQSKLRLYYNDGRNYLATTPEKFDVIISEPSNPWMSGVANLFTVEYFQIVKKRMKPGAIFCQWVQIYELSYENILLILRSLRKVFPYVKLMEVDSGGYDKIVIASMRPISLDLQRLDPWIRDPKNRHVFEPMKLYNSFDLLPRFLLGEKGIDALLKKTPGVLNTDEHNILEFYAPLDLVRQYGSADAGKFNRVVRKEGMNFAESYSWKQKLLSQSKSGDLWLRVAMAYLRYGENTKAFKYFHKARKLDPAHPKLRETWRLLQLMDGQVQPPMIPYEPSEPARKKLWKILNEAVDFYDKDKHEKCIKKLIVFDKKLHAKFLKETPAVAYFLGACSRYADDYVKGLAFYRQFMKSHPKAAKYKPLPGPNVKPRSGAGTTQVTVTSAPTIRRTLPTQPLPQAVRALPTSRPSAPSSRPTSQPTP